MYQLSEEKKLFVPGKNRIENCNIKHTLPPDKLKLCCDSRGDTCVYMQPLNINNDHIKVNRKYCLYQFKK